MTVKELTIDLQSYSKEDLEYFCRRLNYVYTLEYDININKDFARFILKIKNEIENYDSTRAD